MVEYPPCVDSYGQIKELFKKIREAAVPPKFTNDFIYTKLGLKSTSFRAMIPLLKRLGFIDEANVPTSSYREYRDESKSPIIMAQRVKASYSDLFAANEYAYKLKKEEIISKINTLLGTPKEDKQVPKVAATFLELCLLSDFEEQVTEEKTKDEKDTSENSEASKATLKNEHKLGISYTINLNLPATPDIEVFNAIFKSLKEHLLK